MQEAGGRTQAYSETRTAARAADKPPCLYQARRCPRWPFRGYPRASRMPENARLRRRAGRDHRARRENVSESDALDYVLGYSASNDVSCRDLQLPEVCRFMVGYAKSFDGFAPLGPAITSPALLPDPQNIHYTVKVNGETRQQIHTATMIFSVRRVIAHLSRGTTLRRGTVIMMGTDNGIGWDTNQFLKHGDVVTMEFEGIGKMENRIVFD